MPRAPVFSHRLLLAIAGLSALCAPEARAVCMWADVGGQKLGTVGSITGPYSTALTTLDRTLSLDTQSGGKAVFFGYVANKVKLTRNASGGPAVFEFGTVAREMTGGGWTRHGDLSGRHTYQPSWMLMQSPLVTRIYACQPHQGNAGDFRMNGGQGAQWSTTRTPWINDVRMYSDSSVRLEVSGYGVVYGGVNRNYVTLIDVAERWPCEIMKDFSLPTGGLALSGGAGRTVRVHWDTGWGCGTGGAQGPEKHAATAPNHPPTVTLRAIPAKGEPTLSTTFIADARDPDGDSLEYRFRLPGGQWTPWGPENSIRGSFRQEGVYTAFVEVTDIKGAGAADNAKVTVEEREVYIFGNLVYPLSTWTSSAGEVDYSKTMAQEFKFQGNFGGIFERLSPEAAKVSREYGGMFGKMVVIDTAGNLVGIYSASKFTNLNPGFLNTVYDWTQNYNSYKGKVATLPNGQKLRVKENAMASPLIVDIDGDGEPSLLAGMGWQTPRAFSPDLGDYRKVDLDGSGPGWWEWVGPSDALLVDTGKIREDRTGVAHFVFGNSTWGRKWKHGFEPLQTLDKNSSGALEGGELESLGLWADRNGNAKVDDGEVIPVGQAGIESIGTAPDPDSPQGNHMAKSGARKAGGDTLAVWDWWSAKTPLAYLTPRGRVEWKKGPVEGIPRIAVAGAGEDFRDGSLDMHPSGELFFYTDKNGSWFVRVTSQQGTEKSVDMLYPLNVDEDHLDWSIVSGDTGANNHLFWAGDSLKGLTVMNDGRYCSWSGKIVGGEIPLKR